MKWKKTVYLSHRWLGLLISIQLLAWSVGGFMFSILDIDNVHGDWERNLAPPPPVRLAGVRLSPSEAVERAAAEGVFAAEVASVVIRTQHDGQTMYELMDAENAPLAAVDSRTGTVVRRISSDQAKAIALRDFTPQADVVSVRLLEGDPPLEYRGKPMPVYQVAFDHPKNTHVYVQPVTGQVITRRNRPWRVFDFFWMLHIMDYGHREDFNHWLLTAMSMVAILTSGSGLLLWSFRLPKRRRTAQPLE